MAYDPEIRVEARDLYCRERRTYEQVARITGVSAGQLKRWGTDEDWAAVRAEYHQTLRDIEANKIRLRQKLAKEALNNLDPQLVYALDRLERSSQKKDNGGVEPEVDRPKIFLEDLEFIAGILQETDPEGLKVFARNFETIVERFKEQHAQATKVN